MKKKVTAVLLSEREIAPGIFDMWLETDLAEAVKPGQFVAVYPKDKSRLLPRPISICEADEKRQALRLVYRVAGAGTAEFSTYQKGETLEILGVLGNGFPVEKAEGKRALLLGGGIGVPPILELAKRLPGEKLVAAGYRDSHMFLKEDFERYAPFLVATEDGSAGTKGNVMDALAANKVEADVIFACGPLPMLRAVKKYAEEKNIKAYISLEERMACGVGACLGCVCKTTHKDSHSQVNNARICTDGPVFDARYVDI